MVPTHSILFSDKKSVLPKNYCLIKTRGQSGYPQVTCRGRVEALEIRIESGRPKVLPVRRLVKNVINGHHEHWSKGQYQLVFWMFDVCPSYQITTIVLLLQFSFLIAPTANVPDCRDFKIFPLLFNQHRNSQNLVVWIMLWLNNEFLGFIYPGFSINAIYRKSCT